MPSFLRKHSTATIASVALHGAIVAAMTLSLDLGSRPRASLPTGTPIEAVMVDESAVRQQMERIEQREREAVAAREAEERRAREAAEEARMAQEREQERLAALERERQQAEIEARERENARRIQLEREEAERVAREREAEAERQRQAELERQRQEEEARVARERAAEEERRRREAEEAARKQAQLEQELARALAAEEESRRAREAGLLDEYIRSIENQIQQRWIRPPSARPGLECVVNVTQIPSGDVTSVVIGRCNGDDAVVRSIEAAVQRASPLPRPPVPSLFNRNLVITFKPDD